MDAEAGGFTDPGRPSLLGRIAAVLMIATAAFAVARPISVTAGNDAVWMGTAGKLVGLAALACGFGDILRAAMTAETAWRRSGAVVALAGLSFLVLYVYDADRDGTLRLARFQEQFLAWDVLRPVIPDIARGAINTVRAAFLSQVGAIGVGLLLATMKISERRWLRWPASAYVDAVRATPLVVLTLLVGSGFPKLGVELSYVGKIVLVLTINASAYVAEIFRAGIQALPKGQTDAALSLGMPRGTTQLFVVIPQATRAVIPPLVSEFVALVKDTAIVVALLGFTVRDRDIFGAATNASSNSFNITPLVGAALAYMILLIPLIRLVDVLERRFRVARA